MTEHDPSGPNPHAPHARAPSRRKLVLVLAEAALEARIVDDLRDAGATGYTISDVRSAGANVEPDGSWVPTRAVEIRVIAADDVAERLSRRIVDRYGEHYGVVVFVAEGTVLRPERF